MEPLPMEEAIVPTPVFPDMHHQVHDNNEGVIGRVFIKPIWICHTLDATKPPNSHWLANDTFAHGKSSVRVTTISRRTD